MKSDLNKNKNLKKIISSCTYPVLLDQLSTDIVIQIHKFDVLTIKGLGYKVQEKDGKFFTIIK